MNDPAKKFRMFAHRQRAADMADINAERGRDWRLSYNLTLWHMRQELQKDLDAIDAVLEELEEEAS